VCLVVVHGAQMGQSAAKKPAKKVAAKKAAAPVRVVVSHACFSLFLECSQVYRLRPRTATSLAVGGLWFVCFRCLSLVSASLCAHRSSGEAAPAPAAAAAAAAPAAATGDADIFGDTSAGKFIPLMHTTLSMAAQSLTLASTDSVFGKGSKKAATPKKKKVTPKAAVVADESDIFGDDPLGSSA
jgi:hypothetical protein